MTAKEQDVSENIIREIEHRRGHWDRVLTVFGVLAPGAMSLLALVELVVWAATRFAL